MYKYFMAANVFIQVFQKKSIEVVTIMIGLSCFRLCKSFCCKLFLIIQGEKEFKVIPSLP